MNAVENYTRLRGENELEKYVNSMTQRIPLQDGMMYQINNVCTIQSACI